MTDMLKEKAELQFIDSLRASSVFVFRKKMVLETYSQPTLTITRYSLSAELFILTPHQEYKA